MGILINNYFYFHESSDTDAPNGIMWKNIGLPFSNAHTS